MTDSQETRLILKDDISHVIWKTGFLHMQNQTQISLVVMKLISVFVLATLIAQFLYFLYTEFQACMIAQPGLCRTLSETQKTGFLVARLIFPLSCIIFVYLYGGWKLIVLTQWPKVFHSFKIDKKCCFISGRGFQNWSSNKLSNQYELSFWRILVILCYIFSILHFSSDPLLTS